MTTGIVTIIGTIVTAICGPLLAWLLKRWADNKAAAAEAERQARLQEEEARKNSEAQSAQAGTTNTSIDAQREAREKWARENGIPLPK
jgi:H+/gluconate symporter-like permease